MGTTLSSSFSLGTGGVYTQGGGNTIPVLKPVGSSAILSLSQRQEHMAIQSRSLITDSVNNTVNSAIISGLSSSVNPVSPPGQLLVNISGDYRDFGEATVAGAEVKPKPQRTSEMIQNKVEHIHHNLSSKL